MAEGAWHGHGSRGAWGEEHAGPTWGGAAGGAWEASHCAAVAGHCGSTGGSWHIWGTGGSLCAGVELIGGHDGVDGALDEGGEGGEGFGEGVAGVADVQEHEGPGELVEDGVKLGGGGPFAGFDFEGEAGGVWRDGDREVFGAEADCGAEAGGEASGADWDIEGVDLVLSGHESEFGGCGGGSSISLCAWDAANATGGGSAWGSRGGGGIKGGGGGGGLVLELAVDGDHEVVEDLAEGDGVVDLSEDGDARDLGGSAEASHHASEHCGEGVAGGYQGGCGGGSGGAGLGGAGGGGAWEDVDGDFGAEVDEEVFADVDPGFGLEGVERFQHAGAGFGGGDGFDDVEGFGGVDGEDCEGFEAFGEGGDLGLVEGRLVEGGEPGFAGFGSFQAGDGHEGVVLEAPAEVEAGDAGVGELGKSIVGDGVAGCGGGVDEEEEEGAEGALGTGELGAGGVVDGVWRFAVEEGEDGVLGLLADHDDEVVTLGPPGPGVVGFLGAGHRDDDDVAAGLLNDERLGGTGHVAHEAAEGLTDSFAGGATEDEGGEVVAGAFAALSRVHSEDETLAGEMLEDGDDIGAGEPGVGGASDGVGGELGEDGLEHFAEGGVVEHPVGGGFFPGVFAGREALGAGIDGEVVAGDVAGEGAGVQRRRDCGLGFDDLGLG